ncbi:BC1881 family protein [Fusobacterium ulcerans]|uniref:BC1881 family protein n=1 Tax=Fusobacterium ulcerans TaxID=861 RepID=UPI0030A42531
MNKELKDYTTKELTEELIKRDAISSEHILPYEPFAVYIDGKVRIQETGPAILIINQD